MNTTHCRLCGTLCLADYCLACQAGESDWNLEEVVTLAEASELVEQESAA